MHGKRWKTALFPTFSTGKDAALSVVENLRPFHSRLEKIRRALQSGLQKEKKKPRLSFL